MRLVNLDTFLALPEGTIFAKWQPCIFEELCIKGESLPPCDFMFHPLFDVDAKSSVEMYNITMAAALGKEDIPLDFQAWMRDGMYDDRQVFAVFSPEDARGLIARLIEVTPTQPNE